MSLNPESADAADTALTALLIQNGLNPAELGSLSTQSGSVIRHIAVPGTEAVKIWQGLRSGAASSGYWPIIAGDDAKFELWNELLHADLFDPAETLHASEAISIPDWVKKHQAAGNEPPHGPWPDDMEFAEEFEDGSGSPEAYAANVDLLTGKPFARVRIVFAPTNKPWAVPAYLNYGGWNDCPNPEIQVAFFRSWNERYGAEPIGMTGDTVEFTVANPPTTSEAALALAEEQYAFCYDIVEQGTETLERLAAALLNGKSWFFWWD